jgi:hypothetical protein
MSYGSVPHYNSVTPEERDRWKTYLAQRLQKPKEEITVKDWEKVRSFKYTSMIHVALDAGLRSMYVFTPISISPVSRRVGSTGVVDRCTRRVNTLLRDGLPSGDHPVSPVHDLFGAYQRRNP